MKIAVIGGTGDMGYGIALRLGMAGHSVVIGSRDEARAQEAAQRAFAQLNQTGDFTLRHRRSCASSPFRQRGTVRRSHLCARCFRAKWCWTSPCR